MNPILLLLVAVGSLVALMFLLYFWLQSKLMAGAIGRYAARTGQYLELLKVGFPPARHLSKYRYGDAWGRVKAADGTVRWCRFRRKNKEDPIEFFD